MPEQNLMPNTETQETSPTSPNLNLQHHGRGAQLIVYLGKMLRMFIYQSDWKLLPMAAIMAASVALVIRTDYFITMEGTLKGAFALTCLSLWNGCFNSIQVVCRERAIVKREHRAGLHITSYIGAHMIYQALLCSLQSAITLYIFKIMEVKFPEDASLFTQWTILDIWISLFLISYASDMLSLVVSCVAKSTTGAMTVMPFVLMFQLVFSGGLFNLPTWAQSLTPLSISNYGFKALASQSDYNGKPLDSAWNTLTKMKDDPIGGTISVGQILDFLSDKDNEIISQIKDETTGKPITYSALIARMLKSEAFHDVMNTQVEFKDVKSSLLSLILTPEALNSLKEDDIKTITLGQLLDAVSVTSNNVNGFSDLPLDSQATIDENIQMILASSSLNDKRDDKITYTTTVGKLINLVGEEELKNFVREKSSAVSQVKDYEYSRANVSDQWYYIIIFIIFYAILSIVLLEFIDLDRR